MTDASSLLLSAGPLSLKLAPARGGGIESFDYVPDGASKIAVLRPTQGADRSPTALANFPLVPYVNRIRDGRFTFRGREVTLAVNLPHDPSPLHGQGWLAPWEVVRADPAEAELRFRHEAGEWPWSYEARQHFALDPGGLTLTLDCANRSGEPMPCGLGQHPYFLCTPETKLNTGVESVWTVDDKVLPVDKLPAEGRYDLRDRRICGQELDNGFGGWSGRCRVETPGTPFAVEMSSPEARFFQIYSPLEGGFFVAEPVSHANAALNEPEEDWAELGLRVLEPGETMRLTMRIDILPVQ